MSTEQRRRRALERLGKASRVQVTLAVMINQMIASRAGVNPTDLQCLNLLSVRERMTPSRLAEALAMTRGGAVTAMIDRLEKGGYVRRVRSDTDRRQVLVEMVWGTETHALMAQFRPLADIYAGVADPYDAEGLEFLAEYIERSNAALGFADRDTETGVAGNVDGTLPLLAGMGSDTEGDRAVGRPRQAR